MDQMNFDIGALANQLSPTSAMSLSNLKAQYDLNKMASHRLSLGMGSSSSGALDFTSLAAKGLTSSAPPMNHTQMLHLLDAAENTLQSRRASMQGGLSSALSSLNPQDMTSRLLHLQRMQLLGVAPPPAATDYRSSPSSMMMMGSALSSSQPGLESPNALALMEMLQKQRLANGLENLRAPVSPATRPENIPRAPTATATAAVSTAEVTDATGASATYSIQQASRWEQRYQDLLDFKKEYGHCCVPSHWPQNAPLAQWVKRQRSQFKLKQEGKHSNMTQEREEALSALGFVWDSHAVFWEERLEELRVFRDRHGHSNVPTKYPENPQLAIWAKCQRRQFKLFTEGDKRSNMSMERIAKLKSVGFVFNPRKLKREAKMWRTMQK